METKTNDKGYTSIVGLVEEAVAPAPKTKKASKPVELANTNTQADTNRVVMSYDEAKNKKILVQGITQQAMASPGLAGLQYSSVDELADLAEKFADRMITYVERKLV